MSKTQHPSLRSIQAILSSNAVSGQSTRLLEQNTQHSKLLATVRELLPEQSKPHCVSAQLRQDTLVIHADSSSWAAKLRFQLPAVLPALRRLPGYHYAAKASVRIRPVNSEQSPEPLMAVPMEAETAQQIRELASAIRDEKLRQRWLKLADNASSSKKPAN